MVIADYLALFAVVCIWGLLLINIVLIVAGYVYYLKNEARKVPEIPAEVPFVSVMVPAHNEGKVIVKQLNHCLLLIIRSIVTKSLSLMIILQIIARNF